MNIYVSNLSFSIEDADLRQLFEQYGEVSSAKVIRDRDTNRSRGFGFVEMNNDDEGRNAISVLNNGDYDGKTLSVSIAKPKTERTGNSYSGGGKRW